MFRDCLDTYGHGSHKKRMNISIWINGLAHELSSSKTLAELLVELGYQNKKIAAELNEEIIPARLHPQTVLKANDRLEIVQAIGGG